MPVLAKATTALSPLRTTRYTKSNVRVLHPEPHPHAQFIPIKATALN